MSPVLFCQSKPIKLSNETFRMSILTVPAWNMTNKTSLKNHILLKVGLNRYPKTILVKKATPQKNHHL